MHPGSSWCSCYKASNCRADKLMAVELLQTQQKVVRWLPQSGGRGVNLSQQTMLFKILSFSCGSRPVIAAMINFQPICGSILNRRDGFHA